MLQLFLSTPELTPGLNVKTRVTLDVGGNCDS